MKNLTLIVLAVFCPLYFFAQQQLSGLWVGALTNDSSTIRKDQAFELVLAEYKGKVTGYSRSAFIVDDNLYFIVKRVKGTINGDICEVEDDYIVSHNFPGKVDKKVKVISTFYRNKGDSNWHMAGDWKTNQTKKYYSISGKIDLKAEKDLTQSKLFPHLEELGLGKEMPVYQDAKREELAAATKTSIRPKTQTLINPGADTKPDSRIVKTNSVPVNPVISIDPKSETSINPETQSAISRQEVKPTAGTVKTNTVALSPVISIDPKSETSINPEAQSGISRQEVKPTAGTVKTNTVALSPIISIDAKTETSINPEKQSGLNNSGTASIPNTSSVKTNTVAVAPAIAVAETPKRITDPSGAAALIAERATGAAQMVNFVSDSLVVALYDNGEIDGDTVSVLVNGEVFLAKQGLKASAIKKTIYITPGDEEFTMILYAENLGKYPPNTGLLVVYDGEERYQVRFSADLSKNAAITFRRKK